MSTLTTASRQLFSRPDDETFSGWSDILDTLRTRNEQTEERPYTSLGAVNFADRVYLSCADGATQTNIAQLTDWSFSQLCRQISVTSGTINRLSSATAATAINELMPAGMSGVANVMRPQRRPLDDGIIQHDQIRGLYSRRYERVADYDVFKFFHALSEQYGYEPAGNFAGKRGGMAPIRPEASGLYAGASDSFGIIANEEGKIDIDNSTLYHAVMFGNSEVGKKPLWVTDCLYNFICGNHQLWGATRVREIRHRHIGSVRDVLQESKREFFEVTDQERHEHREKIAQTYQAATRRQFAHTRERAQERLKAYMPKKNALGALEFLDHAAAYPKNPLSDWGVGQAITLYSQTLPNQDSRHRLDTAAGKIIQGTAYDAA